ncbi:MAG: TolC family protein [Candidatus Aminicenantes bacterium]|nr:TolC family protein [Candidatus Aminicenantes bacterium]
MKRIVLITMIIWSGIGQVSGQEKLTFEDAIAIALRENHQIEIARNNAAIANNNVNIGNADLLPSLSVNGTVTLQDSRTGSPASDSTTGTAQLQTGYTLFDGLGNIYRFKKLQAGGRLGDLEARDLIETTLLQVSSAYYGAASAYENLTIARDLLAISEERLERAKKRSLYGQARTIDVLSARVDYISDQVTFTQAQFAYDEARRSLNVLLNRDINRKFAFKTGVKYREDYDLTALTASALSRNAAYLAAGERYRQSRYDLKIARANHMPRLDLTASYGFNKYADGLGLSLAEMDNSFRIAASLNLNLFNGFKTTIQRQNARITLKNRELAREQARLNLEREVIGAYESYKNSLQVLYLEKGYVEAAELNFKRARELYNLGQVTTTQFREAQLNLIRARSNLSSARYEARLREIEMLRLTGQLIK